jgi:hypothetical protein
MRTAVGVCTCLRPQMLDKVLRQLQKRSLTNPFIFAALDGPDKESERVLKQHNIPAVISPRIGIANNKNVILDVLQNYDFGFIVEDDLRIIRSGWDLAYFKLWQKTKIHHFNFQPKASHRDTTTKLKRIKMHDDRLPKWLTLTKSTRKPTGPMMAMSKEAIKIVGGFYDKFNPWGGEHEDWTLRAMRAGLMPGSERKGSMSFWEDTHYIKRLGEESVMGEMERQRHRERVRPIVWARAKKCPIYEPIIYNPEITRVGNWPAA